MAMQGAHTGAPFAATPKSASRRSARRSWFETPPATKLDIAVEKPPLRMMKSGSKRRSIDDVETLVLTHFTKPPRVSFGKIVIGRSKTRVLLVQNPADYEQEVVIERFPYKKCFNVDQTHFVVGAEEVVTLTLTWTPQEAGSCREMVLFHVNDVYRLQAYVFGTADDLKPVKKGRKGMLGTRKRQPPSCVVQTKSLKSIHDSYSPRKSDETRELLSRAVHTPHANQENLQPAELDDVIPLTPPPLESTAICKSDERPDQNAVERRKSGFLSPTLSRMSPIPMTADNNNGRILESYFSTTARDQTPVLGSKEAERCPLKAVSGNGNKMSDSRKHGTGSNSAGEADGGHLKNSTHKGSRENSQAGKSAEVSAMIESASSSSSERENPALKEVKGGSASSLTRRENAGDEEPEGGTPSQAESPRVAEVKGCMSHQGESPAVAEAKAYVSPNSFLNDSMARRTLATTPEIGQIRLSNQVNRVAAVASVSPSSFLEDMGSAKPAAPERKSSIPSPSAVLNDSIPHDIMLRQLQFVRRSLHDGSFHASSTPTSAAVVKSKPVAKPFAQGTKRLDRVSQLAQPKARNVFTHAQQQTAPGKKERFLQRKIQERARFAKITDVPSPRRKTFLVNKKQQAGRVSPLTGPPLARKGRTVTLAREVADKQLAAHAQKGKVRREGDGKVIPGEACNHDPQKNKQHVDEADNLDNTATRRRRSLWALPAVAGFEPPVMASKPDCDSTGEELHTLEGLPDQVREDDAGHQVDDQHKETCPPPQHTSMEKSASLQNLSNKTESEGRRQSGRRLFPDLVDNGLNLSADFKPLWSGSATVTKDRPSVSPHTSGSANTSKKLFPDISAEGPSDVKSTCTKHPEEKEAKLVQPMVDSPAGSSQPTKERGESSGSHTWVESSQSFELGSTPQPLASPGEEASRRTTLTVTKARPSQALLHASNNGTQAVAKETKEAVSEVVPDEAEVEEEVWRTETIIIESRNNAIVNVSFVQEHFTPSSKLPSSPKSENSRRSTHAVRNPVVLNKDGLVPRNLFDAVPEQQHVPHDNGENWSNLRQAEVIKDTSAGVVKQTAEIVGENLPVNVQKDSSAMETNRSPCNRDVFTERMEHHLYCQREKVLRPTRFSVAEVVLDCSVSSQELSTDSLEAERRASNSQQKTEANSDRSDANHVAETTEENSTRSAAAREGSETQIKLSCSDQEIPEVPMKTSGSDKKIPEVPMKTSVSDQKIPEVPMKTSGSDQKILTASAEIPGADQKFPEAPAETFRVDQKVPEASVKTSILDQNKRESSLQSACQSVIIATESPAGSQSWLVGQTDGEKTLEIQSQAWKVSETVGQTDGEKTLEIQSQAWKVSETVGQTDGEKTLEIQSQAWKVSETVGMEDNASVSQTHCPESSIPEITPIPSDTAVESQVDIAHTSGPVTAAHPPDGPPAAKLTQAEPNLTHTLAREILQDSAGSTSSVAVSSRQVQDRPAAQGQLRRSVSSELRSGISYTRKHPMTSSAVELESCKHPARSLSASGLGAQALPRTRSQSSLDLEKQSERPNRKRSSPEAGLKDPRSKRVELEPRTLARKSQQPPSRAAPSRKKVERMAKPPRGVALSKLILVKKSKTALPKHPLPFAAKNMYYDERWQDKQERGFVHWLNFVLTPADEYMLTTTKTKVDARSIAFDGTANKVAPRLAPTKEVLSFRAYAARRRLNHLRRASCRLFQSEAVVRVVCRVELEVEQRRLAVRTDRMIHADIGIKQRILDMLLSYNPLWLRIGLETVYGEVLPIQSNSDVIGMSRFILTRLLTNPDISAHYAHPTVPHLYHNGYADAVAQHTMKKFLVLVYFLDCAKQSRLIAHDPCLFCKDAEIKSSKGMLVQFSRDYLSGEGDITKHLAYMGYIVSHAQTPLDEFDYAVTNLCTDLRDGLRLGRIVMLLSGDWSFAPSLRAPAISRLQKIHNVELVFRQLTQRGFDLKTPKGSVLNARDIVDGHREKTLAFLWKLIFHFQTVAMLNEEELRKEVTMLERTLRVKLCMQKLLSRPRLSESMARRDSGGLDVSMDSPMLQLLLKWCRTVCLHYGVKVENFTVSFSDGRALCCLLHHYHPALLPLDRIHFHTSQSLQEAAERAEEGAADSEDELSQDWGAGPFGGETDQLVFEKLLANEKENFKTLYEKVSELGGVPLMLKAADMSNTIPDERVVITYVSYVCARLLDLREETRAARIIQLAWRRLCLRRSAQLRQKQTAACVVIQRAWRQYLVTLRTRRQKAAAVCLQAAWRGRQGRVQAAIVRQAKVDNVLHQAAAKIQTFARRFLSRRRFERQTRSAVVIQSWFRAHQARRAFARQREACLLIQSRYRAHRQAAAVRRHFLALRRSAVAVQRAHRRRRQRSAERKAGAALRLQSLWRGRRCRREFLRQRRAAVRIQAWWRAERAQTRFITLRTAATILQRQWRAVRLGAETRRDFLRRRRAAVTLQKHVRGFQQRRRFRQLRSSAVVIQKNFRRYRRSVKFRALRAAAVVIQTAVRAHQARAAAQRRLRTTRAAAVSIQRWFRRAREARRRAAAVRIQAHFRGRLARKEAAGLRLALRREAAALTIQAFRRAVLARRELQTLRWEARRQRAAVKIQSAFRGHLAVRVRRVLQEEARREGAALKLQSAYRGYLARKQARDLQLAARKERAATKIQSAYRRYLAVKELRALQLAARKERAATKIQSAYRRYLAVKELRALQLAARKERAATKIQSAYRRYLAVKELRALQLAAKRHASAIKIQTLYRLHSARRRVRTLKEAARREAAAARIQAFVRGRRQRRRYQALRRSALLLQTYARGQQARRRLRETQETLAMLAEYQTTHDKFQAVVAEFHRRWNAAVALQAAWRGRNQRQRFLRTKLAATMLQARVRARRLRRQYLRLLESATVLQRRFRARREGQAARLRYQLLLGAAVVVQSRWKAYVVRSCYLQLRARVIRAQAHCRGFLARRRFQRQRRAALCLQRRFRARTAARAARGDYQSLRRAVVCLQAAVRGRQQRRRFLKLRLACITIQSAVKRWLARKRYQTQRRAAVTLQRRWRARLLREEETRRYTRARKAAVTIQSHVRGHLARREARRLHQAARVIQSNYRRHRCRREFLRTRQAAVTLQRRLRAFLCGRQQRRRFAAARRACVTIQSAYRGHVARQRYLGIRRSAVVVQAAVRGRQQRRRYQAVRRAAAVCQSRYRAKRLAQVFRAAFLLIRGAAVVVQKHGRGYLARKAYRRKRRAAILLQAHARGWLQRRRFARLRQAAVVIQRRQRARRAAKAARAQLLRAKQAAAVIQRSWRARQQRLEEARNRAASVIQRQFRRFVAQSKFREDVRRIVLLQAYARGFLARRAAATRRRAIVQIQRRWRETLLASRCRHDFLLKLGAAIVIQSVFRGHRTRVYYRAAVERVVLLQAAFRGCLQRRKYRRLQQAVVLLQRRVRSNAVCRQERRSFLSKQRSAVCIQRAFRRWRARRVEKRIRAATRIQSCVRMLAVRREFLQVRKAVVTLQAAARGRHARRSLLRKKSAIICIQKRVRFYLLVRDLRREVHRRRHAAETIQRAFRKHQARILARKRKAATKIQAAYRGFRQRREFLRQKRAALTLQSAARGWVARRRVGEVRRAERAAMLIQTHFRAWRSRKEEQLRQAQRAEYLHRYASVARRHIAVVMIQRWYRRCVMVREARKQLHCIILLQRRFRAFLQRVRFLREKREAQEWKAREERAARVIQSALRKWRMRQKEKRRVQLITMIQAIWRGRQLRRGLKCRKIAAARKRVEEANEKVTEEKKLGNRTTSALDFLLHYKQLAYILDALMHLDVATRLSWRCCERLVEVNAVGVIYRLILSCNRSLPHMELIKFSVSILLNLAKYEKTTSAVYEVENSVTTLVDLMSIYREKGGAIFTKCCMLLAILGSDTQRKAAMCSDKRLVEKLQSIHALVLRKHRMQVARARMTARSSLNATLPSRLHAPRSVKVRPAWVLRRDSMQEIEDPLAALSFLLDTLHIGPK